MTTTPNTAPLRVGAMSCTTHQCVVPDNGRSRIAVVHGDARRGRGLPDGLFPLAIVRGHQGARGDRESARRGFQSSRYQVCTATRRRVLLPASS